MIKTKSLVSGIGNYKEINKYYDEWSAKLWSNFIKIDYRISIKSSLILKNYFRSKSNNIFDLVCEIELLTEQIIKIFPRNIIDGVDISKKTYFRLNEKIFTISWFFLFRKIILTKKNII